MFSRMSKHAFSVLQPEPAEKKRYLLLLLIVPINTYFFIGHAKRNLVDVFTFLVSFLKWAGMPEGNMPNHRFFNEDLILFLLLQISEVFMII